MSLNPTTWSWFRKPSPPPPPTTPTFTPTPAENNRHAVMLRRIDVETKERALFEDALGWNPSWDLVNPFRTFYDGMQLLFPLFPVRYDRRSSGGNYIFLTDGQLDLFRTYARWSYETNPYAQGGLLTLRDYTIGTGYDYHATSRKGRSADKGLLKRVDRFLEDFFGENRWWELERELFLRTKRDGDAFLELFPQESGVTYCQLVEPEMIRSVNKAAPEWAFGIHTPANDPSRPLAFNKWESPTASSSEEVPAEYMCFFRNHTDRNVKRGLSDFFCMQDVLDDAAKLLRAGRQGESVRQAISYVRQWQQASQATVLAIQAQQTSYQVPNYAPQNPATTNPPLVNVTQVTPGSVEDIPESLEFKDGPKGHGENLVLTLEATLKAAAVKWRLPAWVLTAATDANYASALVAESPHVKAVECEQHAFSERFCDALKKVLAIGVSQGLLPEDTLELVRVETECPPVATRNKKEEFDIHLQLYQAGLESGRTLCALNDLDFDKEQELIAEEPKPTPVLDYSTQAQGQGQAKPSFSTSPAADYARQTNRPA